MSASVQRNHEQALTAFIHCRRYATGVNLRVGHVTQEFGTCREMDTPQHQDWRSYGAWL
jgi:hypothetical protein